MLASLSACFLKMWLRDRPCGKSKARVLKRERRPDQGRRSYSWQTKPANVGIIRQERLRLNPRGQFSTAITSATALMP